VVKTVVVIIKRRVLNLGWPTDENLLLPERRPVKQMKRTSAKFVKEKKGKKLRNTTSCPERLKMTLKKH